MEEMICYLKVSIHLKENFAPLGFNVQGRKKVTKVIPVEKHIGVNLAYSWCFTLKMNHRFDFHCMQDDG